ncbi:MAG: 5-formyltetrahydrofolate cyclo-ligase [Proteobacteria bacterium]|nr:MAG: 5-formyltetrahydrofolate cyclo-ligase [Pseudomonadota bacterium]
MQTQSQIRQYIQQQRLSLSKQQQSDYSSQICEQILNSKLLDKAQHIAFYLPVRGEADPTSLQLLDAHRDKQFYLPILSEAKANHLAFAEYNQQTPMMLNKFKIPEPDLPSEALLYDPSILDVVLMPLVAVDPQGNRIGMGGGFYDRTFAFKQTNKQQSPLLVAFAYDFQLIDPQTPQSWDVAMDVIALQSQVRHVPMST